MTLYLETPQGFVLWTGQAIAGTRYPLSIATMWGESELAAIGLYEPAEAAAIPDGKISAGVSVARVSGVVRFVHDLINKPTPTLAVRRAALLGVLAEKRWQVEVGGMSFGGVPIPTDDRSKLLILASRTRAIEDSEAVKRWKVSNGVYFDLDATTAIALGDQLEAHVAASFAREEVVADLISNAGTHAAMDAAEAAIETGWPS